MATPTSPRLRKAEALDAAAGGPAVVLVEPQLGENIGMVCRAMLNCGLTDLRLVNPREGWSREKAEAAASGADVLFETMTVFGRTEDAIADLHHVYATTARSRDMNKPVVTPRQAAEEMRGHVASDLRCGVLFGRESKGLNNDDVALATAILSVPLNPAFMSLNLAQCVLLIGYEWFQTADSTPDRVAPVRAGTRPATREELVGFFEHLEGDLDAAGFLFPVEKRPAMVRNLRNIFQRAMMTEQEVRTMRGVVSHLSRMKPPENGR
ncbi:MAG: RNA methyltransferase [Rhodospirillales bacterium]|nr:RNA methyltransferase [Rhodospirillales bacterium]MCW9002084.1 RNA methyltransferase [Rhodospirillales bacterium]